MKEYPETFSIDRYKIDDDLGLVRLDDGITVVGCRTGNEIYFFQYQSGSENRVVEMLHEMQRAGRLCDADVNKLQFVIEGSP